MKEPEKYLINNRVCPQPMYWNDLYNIIVKMTGNKELEKPLILGAWHFTSDEEKQGRFELHMKLIEKENLTSAIDFLDSLGEDKWYHRKE